MSDEFVLAIAFIAVLVVFFGFTRLTRRGRVSNAELTRDWLDYCADKPIECRGASHWRTQELRGFYRGIGVHISLAFRRSWTGMLTERRRDDFNPHTIYRLRLKNPAPNRLTVASRKARVPSWRGAQEVTLDDKEFGERFDVHADAPEAARRWLERAEVVETLVDLDTRTERVDIVGDVLTVEFCGRHAADMLDYYLTGLVKRIKRIDSAQ